MMDERKAPVDLVTTSASGLDPHISIAAADFQIPRVASARGISEDSSAVGRHPHRRPSVWLLRRARINVLDLNLALDEQTKQ
jgi:K+-transporting ATPase ATPase C chain